jgi:F-type H+-transporting ATPase subunit a
MTATPSAAQALSAADLLSRKTEAVQGVILHHIQDSPSLVLFGAQIPLPPFLSAHGAGLLVSSVLLILCVGLLRRRSGNVPRGWACVVEMFVQFIRDHIAVPFLGAADGRRLTPLFCSLFLFILAANLMGLLPGFPPSMADVSVTGALATMVLGVMIFGAIWRQGPVGFVRGFVPHGVPFPILLVLVPIEILGLFIKAFALAIRLFANEFAGHVVVLFLIGLVVILGAAGFPFLFMGVLVYLLEIGVAFLQAYVFTLLSALFIGQRFQPEH